MGIYDGNNLNGDMINKLIKLNRY